MLDVKLTTHLQPVPKSRKRGFIHPLPTRLPGAAFNFQSQGQVYMSQEVGYVDSDAHRGDFVV
jgi:hypothetical protein